jgi:hypothetical protein
MEHETAFGDEGTAAVGHPPPSPKTISAELTVRADYCPLAQPGVFWLWGTGSSHAACKTTTELQLE